MNTPYMLAKTARKVALLGEAAAAAYAVLGWKWTDGTSRGIAVPTAADVALTIDHLMRDVDLAKSGSISTGGLYVEWQAADPYEPDGDPSISVSLLLGTFDAPAYIYRPLDQSAVHTERSE